MKMHIAQMRVIPNALEKNFETIERFVKEAKADGAHAIFFPELCLSGTLLGDRFLDEGFCGELMEYNGAVAALSNDIAIFYGNVFVDESAHNESGWKKKFNAAYAYYNQAPLKRNAPFPAGITARPRFSNRGYFDDARYFHSLFDYAVDAGVALETLCVPFELPIEGKTYRIGVTLCEETRDNDSRYNGKPVTAANLLIDNGADMIVNLSASPWVYGKVRERERRISEARENASRFVPFVFVHSVGAGNAGKSVIVFDGGSAVYDENARHILQAAIPYEETALVYDTRRSYAPLAAAEEDKTEGQYRAAREGIRAFDVVMGRDTFPYVLGISGGIDSAVVAALLVMAVGKERVVGVTLPSRHNSEQTKQNAAHIARALEIEFHVAPIAPLVEENRNALVAFNPSAFDMENVQAKVRGASVLSNIAAIRGGLLTNNANKVEIALGYATLYGDTNGAVAPIGDILKTEVFALARYLNETVFKTAVIPESLLPDATFNFEMPPSAELTTAQVDPMKWGYHDALVQAFTDYRKANAETILERYVNGTLARYLGISDALMKRYGLERPRVFVDDLEWFLGAFSRAVFKRVQAPPIVVMSNGSFGLGVRESQLCARFSKRYMALRNECIGVS